MAKGDTWDAYVAGRVGAFVSYAFGEGYPVPAVAGSAIQDGGGVDTAVPRRDTIFPADAMGTANQTAQGKLKKMRVRSGYYPNILTLGVRKNYGPQLKLTAQLSIWGTVESDETKSLGKAETTAANGIRDNGVSADFREGFLRGEGGWGTLQAGRFLGIVGRGMTEIDVLYGHGYGVGFVMVPQSFSLSLTGGLTYPGPTSGMTGFGVLGATYAAGVTYTTPNLSGLKLGVGVFDASNYGTAAWNTNRYPRPEAEITYDVDAGSFKLHVFGSGGFQKFYQAGGLNSESGYGATYGARLEVGPLRVGGGGFFGKGIGVNYAFDDNAALSSRSAMRSVTNPMTGAVTMEQSYALRNQMGFVGMLQVVLGPVDIGGGVGQTQIASLAADKTPAAAMTISHLKTQTGFFGAVVYHVNESLHVDLDYINGGYKWTNGEGQKLNVLNGGVTVTF